MPSTPPQSRPLVAPLPHHPRQRRRVDAILKAAKSDDSMSRSKPLSSCFLHLVGGGAVVLASRTDSQIPSSANSSSASVSFRSGQRMAAQCIFATYADPLPLVLHAPYTAFTHGTDLRAIHRVRVLGTVAVLSSFKT